MEEHKLKDEEGVLAFRGKVLLPDLSLSPANSEDRLHSGLLMFDCKKEYDLCGSG
jgi:hypothetical protein